MKNEIENSDITKKTRTKSKDSSNLAKDDKSLKKIKGYQVLHSKEQYLSLRLQGLYLKKEELKTLLRLYKKSTIMTFTQ